MATALETAIATEIAKLPDGIIKEAATELLAEYVAAKAVTATASADNIVSYTVPGRSVTRMRSEEFRNHVRELESELVSLIYGDVTLADGSYASEPS